MLHSKTETYKDMVGLSLMLYIEWWQDFLIKLSWHVQTGVRQPLELWMMIPKGGVRNLHKALAKLHCNKP